MQPRSPKLLEDIRDAAAFIREATRSSEAKKFRNDRLLRQAVERNFEIIGEAVRRLDREDPETAGRIANHRHIIAFRNVLSHGYDIVDPAVVWSAVQDDLAPLLKDVEALLATVR
jgi:uncharacterized protein with HEPN domain